MGRLVIIASLAVSVVDVYLLGDGRFLLPDLGVIGYALLFAGLGLDIVGRLTLGRFYSETAGMRPGGELVTHGIYKFIRHPIYLGTLLFSFSAPLILRSLLGLLTMTALVPMLILRIRLEEKVLAARFGQEFAEYARRTKRLIPFVY